MIFPPAAEDAEEREQPGSLDRSIAEEREMGLGRKEELELGCSGSSIRPRDCGAGFLVLWGVGLHLAHSPVLLLGCCPTPI